MTEYESWKRSIKKRSIYEAAKRVECSGEAITCISIRDELNKFKTNVYNLNAKQISGIVKTIPVMRIVGKVKLGHREYVTFDFKKEWE